MTSDVQVKLTKPRARVLSALKKRGGKATGYDLSYPRSNMMHTLFMAGLISTEGGTNAWGEPDYDGVWTITPLGLTALSSIETGGK